ncbi:MAG: carbohydrate-binding family 9-like protein [Acidobacteria bacterium]|nr:carbohydrate-binding family 9-like protein [Acidobacteriota bacterium]
MVERPRVEPGAPYRLVSLDGSPGEPETTVAFGSSEDALVARFRSVAEPPLTLAVVRANEPVYRDECVELFLASPAEPGRYLELVVNPLGVLYSARVLNPHDDRTRWELSPGAPGIALPGVEVSIAGPGGEPASWCWWSATIRVAFALLAPAPPACPPDSLLVNATRIARGTRTRHLALSPTYRTSPPDFHVPSRFANLVLSP